MLALGRRQSELEVLRAERPMQDAAREGDHPSVQVFRDFQLQGRLIRPKRVADFVLVTV